MLYFKMKKLFVCIIGIVISMSAQADDITVAEFVLEETDLSARFHPMNDQNGDKAALIKIPTTIKGFQFGSDLGIIATIQKENEIWLYIPNGSKKLTIYHPEYGTLKDYSFPIDIKSFGTYRMAISTKMCPYNPLKVKMTSPFKSGEKIYYFFEINRFNDKDTIRTDIEIWAYNIFDTPQNNYIINAELQRYGIKFKTEGIHEAIATILQKTKVHNPISFDVSKYGRILDILNENKIKEIGTKSGVMAKLAACDKYPEIMTDINIQLEVDNMIENTLSKEMLLNEFTSETNPIGLGATIYERPIYNGKNDEYLDREGMKCYRVYSVSALKDNLYEITIHLYTNRECLRTFLIENFRKEHPDQVDKEKEYISKIDEASKKGEMDQFLIDRKTTITFEGTDGWPILIESDITQGSTKAKLYIKRLSDDLLEKLGIKKD